MSTDRGTDGSQLMDFLTGRDEPRGRGEERGGGWKYVRRRREGGRGGGKEKAKSDFKWQ